MRPCLLGIALAMTLLVAAAPARADIFAVAPVVAPGHSDIDVGLIDASTRTRQSLPAGVNTAANENHPGISADGRRLVFERTDPAAGTDRIILVDVPTGQQVDVFDAFDSQQRRPTSPAITADGRTVIVGSHGHGLTTKTFTNFPAAGGLSETDAFQGMDVLDPTPVPSVAGGSPIAYRVNELQLGAGTLKQVFFAEKAIEPPMRVKSGRFEVEHPSLNGLDVVYDFRALDVLGNPGQADIGFCRHFPDTDGACTAGEGVLPKLVSSPTQSETRPAFTPDGRYIGFIRDETTGHERLYVFDTETQTLVDPSGADLGLVSVPDSGSLNLYERSVFTLAAIPALGTLDVHIGTPVAIGLLVQRVVGHHRLLGRRVPKLKPAGRIPLGHFRGGHHGIHWRPRVRGHRLRPGRYQFTPRALTRSGRIRDLGTPRILRVR